MAGANYTLYFGTLKVGVVSESEEDFPSLSGDVVLDPALDEAQTPDAARFTEFLRLNRESTRLVDVSHTQDVREELAAVNTQLDAYVEYVHSDAWHLVDAQGTVLPILCPIFRGRWQIVWRWGR